MLLQVQSDSKRVYYRIFVSSIVFWDEYPYIAIVYLIYIDSNSVTAHLAGFLQNTL